MNNSLASDSIDALRKLPSVDRILQQSTGLVGTHGHEAVASKARECLVAMRESLIAGHAQNMDKAGLLSAILKQLGAKLTNDNLHALTSVFNLSGTILHTNLGRALLPECAVRAVAAAASEAVNLEFDLIKGERGERDSHVEALVCELTGAEAATVVNNNAAAVLLVLNSLARGKEVPVSRGELVEIGGSFRIPEVMERSGCTLVEVGATNRTHLKDYANALNANTALLMKVHTSNYRIEGFIKEVKEQALAELAHQHDLPFVMDMGSGSLVSLAAYGLPSEPTAREMLDAGADIVTFSGDKLLGGPQCGIVAGSRELIAKIRSNPLKRALRPDKMTLAALAAVLQLYRTPERLVQELPAMRDFTRPLASISEQALKLLPLVAAALPESYSVSTEPSESQIGSGALPIEGIPSVALLIRHEEGDKGIRQLASALRKLPKPVIGRIHKGSLWLDLRCLHKDDAFIEQLALLEDLLV